MSDKLFFLNGSRAMISLGPLTATQHCPYRCAFCYVQDGFDKYAALNENQILDFLKNNRENYSIIYISGDTDSFAPPRTQRALMLLQRIVSEIDCDLLFTTRTVFSENEYLIIKNIVATQNAKKKKLYSCVSITRYSESVSYIEPKPIPSPDERIISLKKLKEIGAITVLAMRPFLPVVSINDYITILDKTKGFIDIALGECFYFVPNGKICNRVFPNGISDSIRANLTHNNKMQFDNNEEEWDIWNSSEYEKAVRTKCEDIGVVFSMYSDEAIKEYLIRKKYEKRV
jgi:hypothetical protein